MGAVRHDASASERASLLAAIGCAVALVARWTRRERVTLHATSRARGLIGGVPAAADASIDIDTSGDATLETMVQRVLEAPHTDVGTDHASAIVIDTGAAALPAGGADIALRFWCVERDVCVAADYEAARFDGATIDRVLHSLARMYRHAAQQPDAVLARSPLVDADDERRLVHDLNATTVARTGVQRIHRVIEAQARRSPDAVAAELDGRRLTYAALDAHASAAAQRLIAAGVGHDRVVGVCFERSFELLVALLAIHKAGGAFLPLDIDLPRERMRYMLADADCTLVLTHGACVSQVDAAIDATATRRDVLPAVDDAQLPAGVGDPCDRAGPMDLAYVMYTSGSTGQPKGVLVTHGALCNHALWFSSRIDMTAHDRVLQHASISFDAALPELLAPLAVGATVVFAPAGAQRDLQQFPDLVRRERITVAQLVPSALRIAVASSSFAEPTTLRYLVSGGETLDGALAAQVKALQPAMRLGNFYGPTEATVDATSFEVPGDIAAGDIVPIGTPIANARCRILDPHGALVPIGMPGELHIGGRGLAAGYHKQPARTASSFIADPWLPAERLYRTGDLARYRNDGNIEYLGRIDTQVKVRGYRIETSEVEAQLLAQASVRQAAVVLRDDASGEEQLVAYVVADGGAPVSPGVLRERLREHLPPWMVPSAFVTLDALPLSPSGKLDRRALPAPHAATGGARTAPRPDDPVERGLQGIWERVLGVRDVGIDDDFFELGGHSLKAIRVLAEIERDFGRALRASVLFDAPTIRALAARVRDVVPPAPTTIVAVRREGARTPLFFAPGGGGELFVFDALARALDTDQPLYVIDLFGFDEVRIDVAEITLEDIAARVIVDIRRIQPRGPYQFAGYSLGGGIVLEIAQQLRAAGDDVHIVVLLDCDGPGYPIMQPFFSRLVRHVSHAGRLGAADGLRYLGQRVANLSRFVTRDDTVDVHLYADQEESRMVPTQVIEALERALEPVLVASQRYVPRQYGGTVLLVRADIRYNNIGILDDDPLLGWGPVITGTIRTAAMACDHFAILHSVNATRLAAILRPALVDADTITAAPPAIEPSPIALAAPRITTPA